MPAANRNSYYRQLFLDHGADLDAWRKSYAVYWGFTTLIDDQLGRVLAELEAQGIMDDTIVVYLSDHGENLGAHGLWHKMVAYEESVRVPLILRLPGRIQGGPRSEAPVSQVDIAPTLADLCGLPPRPEWVGQSLADVLAGTAELDPDRPLFCLHRPLGEWMRPVPWRMVTRRALKYVWNQGDRDELFDLERDPHETANLIEAPDYAESLRGLRNDLADFMRQTSDALEASYRDDAFDASDTQPIVNRR